MRRLSFVLVVAGALLVGGAAVAATGPGNKSNQRPAAAQLQARGAGLHAAAARYLGLTPARLRTELRSGKSLAQVATARGKSVDGLKAALLAAVKTKVDAAVATGRIDAVRAQRLLANAPARIDRLVQRTGSGMQRPPHRGGLAKPAFGNAAATYLGLTRQQLRAELRSGKSLAQIATERGKSVDGLKAALLAAVKTKVDAAVAAGRIDAARAQRLLANAPALIDRVVARTPRR